MKIEIVTNYDDWSALYVDGKLVTQGHEITLSEFAKAVGVDVTKKEVDVEWLAEQGCLPQTIGEIPEDVFK